MTQVYKIPFFLTKHANVFDYDTQTIYIDAKIPDHVISKFLVWMNSSKLPITINNTPSESYKTVIEELCTHVEQTAGESAKQLIGIVRRLMEVIDTNIWDNLIDNGVTITDLYPQTGITIEQVESVNALLFYLGENVALSNVALTDPSLAPNTIFSNIQLVFLVLIYWYIIDGAEIDPTNIADQQYAIFANTELAKTHAFSLMLFHMLTFRINSIWIESPTHPFIIYMRNKLKECPGYKTLMRTRNLTAEIQDNIDSFIEENNLSSFNLMPYILFDYMSRKQRSEQMLKYFIDVVKIKSVNVNEIFDSLSESVKYMSDYGIYSDSLLNNMVTSSLGRVMAETLASTNTNDQSLTSLVESLTGVEAQL